jgi:hypothetical protein
MTFPKRKRKIRILKEKKYSKFYKVNDIELSALKRGVQLMDIARDHFKFGAGNQYHCYFGSDGENYIRWKKARALIGISRNADTNDFFNFFNQRATKEGHEVLDDCAENIIIAYYAARFINGGACREQADLMAFLTIMFRNFPEQYRRIKLIYLAGTIAHYILVVEANGANRSIVLDPWVPASQACIFEHSRWGGLPDKYYELIWTLNLDEERRFGHRYLNRLRQYGQEDIRQRVENNIAIETFLNKGESVEVDWICTYNKCQEKWKKTAIITKNGKKICPKCKKAGRTKEVEELPKESRKIYYKIPFEDIYVAKRNSVLEIYENLGIIKKSLVNKKSLLDTDKYHIILPYTNKDKPDEEDLKFWNRHHLYMRTYQWGVIE